MKKICLFVFFLFSVFLYSDDLKVEKTNIIYRDEYLLAEGDLPLITLPSGAHYNNPKEDFYSLLKLMKMESRRYFIENKKSEIETFVLKSDYKVSTTLPMFKSIVVKNYYYTGGVHGVIFESTYNFFNGHPIALKDLFKEEVNYKNLLKSKIEEIIIDEDPSLFYREIKIPEEEFTFYLTKDNLVILFNPYDIGPFSSGIPKFYIPLTDIKVFLKPKFVTFF